jgi:D-aspartate ligase
MPSLLPAVILGEGTNALGAIRSLASAGIPTILVAHNGGEIALHSRLPIRKVTVAGGGDHEVATLAALDSLALTEAVLIPTSDYFVSFIVRHRERLARHFQFSVPTDELAAALIDKALETKLVSDAGIPLPATLQHLPDSPSAFLKALPGPAIIKPRSFREMARLKKKNVVVRSAAEVESFYRDYGDQLDGLIAQDIIPGGDETIWVCNTTFNADGRMVAAFTFRRLRLSPPHYGVTTYAESIANPDVLRWSAMLGERIRYAGPAMIEFKQDQRDQIYKYIEINPRIGMCNIFDTRCGVNNVHLAYRLARGEHLEPQPIGQREGVMYLNLFNDLYSRRLDGESPLAIAQHYTSHALRRHVFAIWDWRDPAPALHATSTLVRRILRSRVG